MPTIVYTFNSTGDDSTAIEDAMMHPGAPDVNTSSWSSFQANSASGAADYTSILRLSDLSGIPGGSTITGVQIQLYDAAGGDACTVDLYRVLRATVVSQMTRNIYSTGNSWGTAGGIGSGTDRAASASGSLSATAGGGAYVSATDGGLIADVQAWLDASATNGGWLLMNTTTGSTTAVFESSESVDGQMPIVTVTYTTGGGSAPRARMLLLGVG